jgi:predicted RNA-binding protein
MCLAKAFLGSKDNAPIVEEIASVKAEDGKLLVTTLFGEKRELEASIKEIDFRASNIILESVKS